MPIYTGTPGNDALGGSSFDDLILGYAGDDFLDGRGGEDRLEGSIGNDTYVMDNLRDLVIELAGEGFDTIFTEVSLALADETHVEYLSARSWRSTTNLNLTGNSLANILAGNDGANFLDGGAGADRMVGFKGDDIYVVDHAGDEVFEARGDGFEGRGDGHDIVFAEVDYTLSANIEVLSARDWTSTTPLQLTGNATSNAIAGNAGNNRLDGGQGTDIMEGFGGDDTYIIDAKFDHAVEAENGGNDTILFDSRALLGQFSLTAHPQASPGYAQVENVSPIDPTYVSPSGGIYISGNELNNRITGSIGNDSFDGFSGSDVMIGLGGNDFYRVDNPGDQVVEAVGGGEDIINTASDYTLPSGSEVEWLSADPNGRSYRLLGNELSNFISGNRLDDWLDGGSGNDTFRGGNGADQFAFTTALASNNIDRIEDFYRLEGDRIVLDRAIFTGLAAGDLPASAFVDGTAAQDADDRIIYNSSNGQLFFDADGVGGNDAVLFASLSVFAPFGHLTAADIFVI